jgi:hypothetical protein
MSAANKAKRRKQRLKETIDWVVGRAMPLKRFEQIARLAHKHEVQYWLDEPGTDAEKLGRILAIARDGIAQHTPKRRKKAAVTP